MSASFRFLGFACFLITASDGTRILIDPFLKGNSAAPETPDSLERVNLILVSHAAFDHLGDAAEIAIKHGCPVITGGDCKLVLLDRGVPPSQIIETTYGLTVEAAGIRVRPVQSLHRSAATLPDGRLVTAPPLGFIIFLPDGTRVYNASDTALFSDLKLIGELHRPQVGLINVTIENCFPQLPTFLSGEMTPYEAALASQWLGLEYAVACHYTNADNDEVRQFERLLGDMRTEGKPYVKPVVMQPGESFIYDK